MEDVIYHISEIFYSIQGEGANAGMPAIFVRFHGCNLDCHFCDEKNKNVTLNITMKEILEILIKWNCKNIILTGGEPTQQDIIPLIYYLKSFYYNIFLETNGINCLSNYYLQPLVWITISPKTCLPPMRCNEIKIVYSGQSFKEISSIITNISTRYIYLQPESNKEEYIKQAIELLKDNSGWRLSLQIQKLIKIK